MVALNKHCLNKLPNKMIIVQKSVKLRGDNDDDPLYLFDSDARLCLLILSMILCPTDSPAAFCKSHQSKLILMLIMAFSVTHTSENFQFIYSLKVEAQFHQEKLKQSHNCRIIHGAEIFVLFPLPMIDMLMMIMVPCWHDGDDRDGRKRDEDDHPRRE